jgi:aminoglycoside phosphotransferase (APT) family kinase protein
VITHGDLQLTHVFVDDDEITGVIDWSEAGQGDARYDLASLTLGREEHLGDVVAGYGTNVAPDRASKTGVVAGLSKVGGTRANTVRSPTSSVLPGLSKNRRQ